MLLKSQNKNSFTVKSAKSTDEAIAEALKELNASMEDVDIEVIEKGSKGFLGMGAKDATVKVSLKGTEAKPEPKKAQKPVKKAEEPKADLKLEIPSKDDEPCTAAKVFLDNLFKAMQLEVNVAVSLNGDMMTVNLEGDNMGIVIGKRGDTLDSIQYLTSLVANRRSEEYIKVNIDTENYREKRAQALVALSMRLADKVARTGKKFTLEPMNPYERRIIHSNLQDNENVTTFSIGTEPYRKVVIAPKNKPGYEKSNQRGAYKKPATKRTDETQTAEKTGSYTTTYKADFKPTPHKAEYKTYAEYLAAQNGEIIPPMNSVEEE